jgi:hypothetical protein
LTCATLGDVNGDGKQELLGGTSNGITWFGSTADNVISQIGTSNEGQDIRSIAIAEIPEPATIFLLGLGATALLRKKK